MSEPEAYTKIGDAKFGDVGVYYVDVHRKEKVRKCVGIGTKRFPEIYLEPSGALLLLAWLEQERHTLERLAKEQQ